MVPYHVKFLKKNSHVDFKILVEFKWISEYGRRDKQLTRKYVVYFYYLIISQNFQNICQLILGYMVFHSFGPKIMIK